MSRTYRNIYPKQTTWTPWGDETELPHRCKVFDFRPHIGRKANVRLDARIDWPHKREAITDGYSVKHGWADERGSKREYHRAQRAAAKNIIRDELEDMELYEEDDMIAFYEWLDFEEDMQAYENEKYGLEY